MERLPPPLMTTDEIKQDYIVSVLLSNALQEVINQQNDIDGNMFYMEDSQKSRNSLLPRTSKNQQKNGQQDLSTQQLKWS